MIFPKNNNPQATFNSHLWICLINGIQPAFNAGIAGAIALSGIPYVNNSLVTSFGMPMGSYRIEGAIAGGFQRLINENVNTRINMTWGTGNDTVLRSGLSGARNPHGNYNGTFVVPFFHFDNLYLVFKQWKRGFRYFWVFSDQQIPLDFRSSSFR